MTVDAAEHTRLTCATWVYQLHIAGIPPADAELERSCTEVERATDRAAGEAAGEALVRRTGELLSGAEPNDVLSFARRMYGDRVGSEIGAGERDERTTRIRKYQFSRSLPWLARIWERRDGSVHPTWLLVERVTDEVTAMDPNPWNDVDEERRVPVGDFHVLWELDGCSAVAVH